MVAVEVSQGIIHPGYALPRSWLNSLKPAHSSDEQPRLGKPFSPSGSNSPSSRTCFDHFGGFLFWELWWIWRWSSLDSTLLIVMADYELGEGKRRVPLIRGGETTRDLQLCPEWAPDRRQKLKLSRWEMPF